jgi:3-oxoacyl-[acyl-carrier-protein] synthase II
LADSGYLVGAVLNFDDTTTLGSPSRKISRKSRNTHLAYAAAMQAFEAAESSPAQPFDRQANWQVLFGVTLGGLDVFERELRSMLSKDRTFMSPYVMGFLHLECVSIIREALGLRANLGTISNSCVSGLDAIVESVRLIRDGIVESSIAGGSDAPLVEGILAGFDAVGMLSSYKGLPGRASRPFDVMSEGGILSEGAASVVMEPLDAALFRGAKPQAEVLGFGMSSDEPGSAPGSGLYESMRRALANSSLMTSDIDYISAHGPGDRNIDRAEGLAVLRLFGSLASRIPISSIKGSTGNPLAAGGVMQVVSCLLALQHGRLPPNLNLERPDPSLPLDFVVGEPRGSQVRHLLINSHGMGGGNTSVVLKAWKGH